MNNETPNSPQDQHDQNEAIRRAKQERRAKIFAFIGRWNKLVAVFIVGIGILVYIGIIQPLTRNKDLVKVSTAQAGQAFCTSDTAQLNTPEYKKGGKSMGVGVYTKNPQPDETADIIYKQKLVGYTTGDGEVDAVLRSGSTSIGTMPLLACIDQTDEGASDVTCEAIRPSKSPIHKTSNTVKLYETKTHKLVAEKTLPSMKAEDVECDSAEANVAIDYKFAGGKPPVIYAPVDPAALADFLREYI